MVSVLAVVREATSKLSADTKTTGHLRAVCKSARRDRHVEGLHALGTCRSEGTSGERPIELEVVVSEGARRCPDIEGKGNLFDLKVAQLYW